MLLLFSFSWISFEIFNYVKLCERFEATATLLLREHRKMMRTIVAHCDSKWISAVDRAILLFHLVRTLECSFELVSDLFVRHLLDKNLLATFVFSKMNEK